MIVTRTNRFESLAKRLRKRNRRIEDDLRGQLVEKLERGELPGDRAPETHGCIKVRVRNSSNGKGSSGGYRVIYRIENGVAVLLLITEKSDRLRDLPFTDVLKNI